MDLRTAASVLNSHFEVSSLRGSRAIESPRSTALLTRQSLKSLGFSPTTLLDCCLSVSADLETCTGEGRATRIRVRASFPSASSGDKDLRRGSSVDQACGLYNARDHNLRMPGRVDSKLNRQSRGRGTDGKAAASVAAIVNAVTLVEQEKRTSNNSLVLTPKDFSRRSTKFARTERDRAGQKKKVVADSPGGASKKLCVAVDVDEVLGSFLAALNVFIEETYSQHHDISEYNIYDFMKIWNCSQIEANHRVHAFFESDHFKNGIKPIPGARDTLRQLAKHCHLVVVTSRQHIIREITLSWIDRYYAGIFKEVHFGNHYALEGSSKPKSEICRSLGAKVLIDDNPGYAMECAASGIEVLLFDLQGSYPWSKTPCGPEHPLITRVKNWQEVQQELLARTCAPL